jgi:hypothetical protein
MNSLEQVRNLAAAPTLGEKWSVARKMMSSKAKPEGDEFYQDLQDALEGLGRIAQSGDDISRLVAIDLLVRLPASMKNNKRVQEISSTVRQAVLSLPLPPLALISETRDLPDGAKPAEIRENVAVALNDASGEWVLPFAFRAFGDEDRSQRCRLALAREIALRSFEVDSWFDRLLEEPSLDKISERDPVAAAARLQGLCESLVEAIRSNRAHLKVTPRSGQLLAKLCRSMVSPAAQQRPKGLDETAKAAINLLDEILAVRLTIMDEPDLYDPVQVVHRWWSPRPFPQIVEGPLQPIVDKLTAGLVFRARGGQTSDVLLQRLKQAINNDERFRLYLKSVVEGEAGFSDEVQDWLLGRQRGRSEKGGPSVLAAVATESFVKQLAEILRASSDDDTAGLRRAIMAIAAQHSLVCIGNVGDIVEYLPNVYDLPHGEIAKERLVRILRPPIVRRRHDGGSDVILKGLAANA